MPDSLTDLEAALAPRWTLETPWSAAGVRITARAHDRITGTAVVISAVHCAGDGMATASLAREIGVHDCLAHHPALVPMLTSGREAGWLYMVLAQCGPSLAHRIADRGPLSPAAALSHAIVAADLLHFAHGLGIVHGAVSAECLFLDDAQLRLGGFDAAARVTADAMGALAIAADVHALASTLYTLCTALPWHRGARLDDALPPELVDVLHRALHRDADVRFATPIAFAQALCLAREALEAGEVQGRDGSALREHDAASEVTDLPLDDSVERSLRVLHALLDRAEVSDLPPDPADPLVQRCWSRADAQVSARDARLVALRCRWRLLADRDPVAALSASRSAADAREVLPYRARALAALGRAAEARALAVRSWFDDEALDLPALRSLMMALLLTRAFDLATLVGATEEAQALGDPVIAAAGEVASRRGGGSLSPPAQARALRAIAAAIDRGVPWTAELLVDPRWDALRSDSRFGALLARSQATWTR